MFCHGELARHKPDPRHLTRFYLMMSVGGALGAVLIAIVAPLTLNGYFELNISLVALALLLMLQLEGKQLLIGIAVVFATSWYATKGAQEYADDMRVMERDFYGVVRIRDREYDGTTYRAMLHGSIIHGGQLLGEKFKGVPSDYFSTTSGYGRMFAAMNEIAPGPRRIGVIGLGAGVVAAYGRQGDDIVFYEISPKVIEIEKREFSFLRDTPAKTSVIIGDGRLSLERETPRRYHVLGIDAFGYGAALNLTTLGSNVFLGSTQGGNYTGATLGIGTGSTYRLGGGGGTLAVNSPVLGSGALVVGAVVGTGATAVVNMNSGQVNLNTANSFTGGTTLNGGVALQLGDNGALGSGTDRKSVV
jgi:hypothetical protein